LWFAVSPLEGNSVVVCSYPMQEDWIWLWGSSVSVASDFRPHAAVCCWFSFTSAKTVSQI